MARLVRPSWKSRCQKALARSAARSAGEPADARNAAIGASCAAGNSSPTRTGALFFIAWQMSAPNSRGNHERDQYAQGHCKMPRRERRDSALNVVPSRIWVHASVLSMRTTVRLLTLEPSQSAK